MRGLHSHDDRDAASRAPRPCTRQQPRTQARSTVKDGPAAEYKEADAFKRWTVPQIQCENNFSTDQDFPCKILDLCHDSGLNEAVRCWNVTVPHAGKSKIQFAPESNLIKPRPKASSFQENLLEIVVSSAWSSIQLENSSNPNHNHHSLMRE